MAKKILVEGVEVLIERILTETKANIFIKASKSPKIGSRLLFPDNYIAEILCKSDGIYKVEFSAPINEVICNIGSIPIPPYLNRDSKDIDNKRYQTILLKNMALLLPQPLDCILMRKC